MTLVMESTWRGTRTIAGETAELKPELQHLLERNDHE